MEYIATFHTHLGAMTFHQKVKKLGDQSAQMMPVPRALSSSCGTCVRFTQEFDPDQMYDEDLDQVAEIHDGKYHIIFQNDD